jgi:excisionase family DNA binding protein
MTLREAAVLLGVSVKTLQNQAERGSLRADKLGKIWTVTGREVERYRREHLGQRKGGPRPKKGRRQIPHKDTPGPNESSGTGKEPQP